MAAQPPHEVNRSQLPSVYSAMGSLDGKESDGTPEDAPSLRQSRVAEKKDWQAEPPLLDGDERL
jgi:hypothetical protein